MKIKSILIVLGLMLFMVGCATTEPVTTEPVAQEVVEPVQPMEMEPEPMMEEPQRVEEATKAFEESQRKGM